MSSELLPEQRTYSGFQRFKLAGTLISALALAACRGQQGASPTPDVFDGLYVGTTSQGADFAFKAKQNNIRAWGIGFNIPGCATDNMAIEYSEAMAKERPIEQNAFSLAELNALQGTRAAIQGTFDPDSNVWKGNADIDCKGSKLQVAWTASFAESSPQRQIPPEMLARIPDLKIPQGLFIPGKELSNPYRFQVLAERGDWFLVAAFDSLYPVPKSWVISSVPGQDDGLLLFAKGGIEVSIGSGPNKTPEIAIQIGGGEVPGEGTSEQVIAETEKQLKSLRPDTMVIKKEIVDSKRGYIIVERPLESGVKKYRLIVASKIYTQGVGRETFRTIIAEAEGQAWFDYYPVIRAIVANWASTKDNITAGVVLPERLP